MKSHCYSKELTAAQLRRAMQMIKDGFSNADVARRFNVSHNFALDLRHGRMSPAVKKILEGR